ncbi:MAG TPA: hypothetical protein VN625_11595, partial [Desulfuromonadaceae bacterium]|nr:hypothetical protein [Desulfuromonadaceae bacterium]
IPVSIRDQPTELVFKLMDLQTKGRLARADITNEIGVAIAPDFESHGLQYGIDIQAFLINENTNGLSDLLLPSLQEQFEITLTDSSGAKVSKTLLGLRQGQPLSAKPRPIRLEPVSVPVRDAVVSARFDLRAYFDIRTPGDYLLTYRQRLYRVTPAGKLEPLIFPPVTLPVKIR